MAPSASQASTTPIPVPTSLTSTTPSLPPLTSQLLIQNLRATSSTSELQHLLTDSLARTGWTDRVRALALELLRNGSCDTFPDLLEEVLRRAKVPKDSKNSNNKEEKEFTSRTGGKTIPGMHGAGGVNGSATSAPAAAVANGNANGAIAVREGWFGPDGLPDVRIPEKTVEVGVEFLKERIADLIEPVDDN